MLPTLVVWVVAHRPFEQRGRVSGLWNSAFFLGQFLAPLVATGLATVLGGLPVAVGVIGAGALFVGILAALTTRAEDEVPAV
jgi:MFS family permease